MNRTSAVSIGIAIVAGCLVLGLLLREQGEQPEKREPPEPYQIVALEKGASDRARALLLDTRTGRCWYWNNGRCPTQWSEITPNDIRRQSANVPAGAK